MTERQVFGLIVRTLGLVSVLYGLSQLLVAVARLIGPNVPHYFPFHEDVIFGLFWLAFGALLMRRVGWLVRFAYGPESN
jgi:hypothetical protein